MNQLYWQERDVIATLSLSLVCISFIVYHFLVNSKWFAERWKGASAPADRIISQRLAGLVIMGLIPFGIALAVTHKAPTYFGFGFQNMPKVLLWTLAASAIVLPLSFLNARKPANLDMYPQIRTPEWTFGLLFRSNLTWVLYLIGYETLFRGILFFPLLDQFGLIPALVVNVAIYSIAHIPKGITETVGAIPFGIVVCLAAAASGVIWFPILIHCVMALSSEWFSLYFHPEMRLKKSN